MQTTSRREEIAANVRSAMAYRRVDQGEIADVIGRSRASVSERVNGKTHFRIEELEAIAAHLEVTLDQLLAPAPTEAAS